MSDSRCFVIAGGSGGIGRALCGLLSRKGHRLFITGRDAERLQAACEESGAEGMIWDVAQERDFSPVIEAALERFGRLDGAVNLCGSVLLKPAHMTSDSDLDAVLAANLLSAFSVTRSAAKALMKSGGGSIVLVSSAAARVGLANHEAIAAAKAGVIGLTLSAAATYAGSGIRVNCVAPGLVRTPATARITANEASLKMSEQMHPLGRIGDPQDVASAIAWLLDPEAGWVTGQVIGVDGGLATVRSRGT
ncbi:MAG: SDR family NAD(P)-dependent oxidoreductase [Armatimonadota bacterium]|jgi:NAD(P)-dependent dehydrogenase (short-subunit alcohol dehydrogenase family)